MRSVIMGAASQFHAGLKGTLQLGYYGVVKGDDFIQAQALSTLVGMDSTGTLVSPTSDWLKFAYKGKTLMIPLKAIRYNLSHSQLRTRNLVDGSVVVTVRGQQYKVRLINGITGRASAFPLGNEGYSTDPVESRNTEFSDLFYPLSVNGGIPAAQRWESFTDAQLWFGTSITNGRAMIVAEYQDDTYQIFRGDKGIKNCHKGNYSGIPAARGWRPVLELVG